MEGCIALLSSSELETIKIAKVLASVCSVGCSIYLYGSVGLGKTSFCRGFLVGLGYFGIVRSPTYTLVESYIISDVIVHHFDLYRLNSIVDLEYIGVRDYFNSSSVCLVEWPKFRIIFLPQEDISVTLKYFQLSFVVRKIILRAFSSKGRDALKKLSLCGIKFYDETTV